MKKALTLAVLAAAASGTFASGPERAARVPLLPAYAQECSACHVAYPPSMLPAASWQRLLDNLPRHFGTDASLDAPTVKALSQWLGTHAGDARGAAASPPPEDRITRTAWFQHEHDELPASVWQRASIRSRANCAACHAGAAQGDFSEHGVRIPK